MEPETKQAFEKIIKSIQKDWSLYSAYPRTTSRDENKFTTMGLCDLACNHLFDDFPGLFWITKHQGHVIREYFHMHLFCINELYKEFPGVFEGETRNHNRLGDYGKNIDENIPRF